MWLTTLVSLRLKTYTGPQCPMAWLGLHSQQNLPLDSLYNVADNLGVVEAPDYGMVVSTVTFTAVFASFSLTLVELLCRSNHTHASSFYTNLCLLYLTKKHSQPYTVQGQQSPEQLFYSVDVLHCSQSDPCLNLLKSNLSLT